MEDLDCFPSEIIRSPQPLVGFFGLDLGKDFHRRVWEVFTSNRGLDRHSLYFVNLPSLDELSFPPAKPKKTSYEWYVPKGILKKNWILKHQNVIPSVIVMFIELNWNDKDFVSKTQDCALKVQKLKKLLQGRGTKISVVLLQNESSTGETESLTTFCTECEISPRSLSVIGHKDQLLASVIRLEAALHEVSQNYYHNAIKNVRSHKDALNKSTHMLLLIRHMFKIGYFNEMKNDLHSAQKAYQTAYSLIMESKMNDFNVGEYRTVGGFINYKICRLAFKLNLPREAISHFRKHLDNFKSKSGVPELSWEHAAWQATQAAMFAHLFLDAHRNGQQAIQTQHPGIYFQLAADYAISRRKLAEEQCSQIQSYPDPDPLFDQTQFYGQRPWRPGKLEPVDIHREKEGIEALQYRERTKTKHSQIIIKLQEAAIQQFDTFNSPRMKNQVLVHMAEELMVDQKYENAMECLEPCAEMYRKEGWFNLSTATLLKAMKCAFLVTNIEIYVRLCLDLSSPESTCSESEKTRIEQNLWLVLGLKPPLPEPSLTGKNERASVGHASKSWKEKLEKLNNEIVVSLPETSVIDIVPSLPKVFKIGDGLKVLLAIKNRSKKTLNVFDICCQFNIQEYNNSKFLNFIEVGPGDEVNLETTVSLNSNHVDKVLRLLSVQFKLGGSDNISFHKDFKRRSHDNADNFETKLVPRDSNVKLSFNGYPPLLIGEWFDFRLTLESKEQTDASQLEVLCWLRDGVDPLISDTTSLSTFPGFPTTPTTPGGSQPLEMVKSSVVVPILKSGASQTINFYIRASTVGIRAVVCQLRYAVEVGGKMCTCSSFEVFELDVVTPFSFDFSILNLVFEETKQLATDEPFLMVPTVSSLSPHNLILYGDSKLEARNPLVINFLSKSTEQNELSFGSKFEFGFPAVVPRHKLLSQLDNESINLGKFHLNWRRSDSENLNQTVFELQNISVSTCFMSLRCDLPAFGVLRTPANFVCEVINKTDFVQEYSLTMDPSDSFMFSGPKQLRLKVFPRDLVRIEYLLYPLLSGSLILPKLKILPLTSGGVASLDKCGIVEEIVSRTLPVEFLVLPLRKTEEQQAGGPNPFELKELTVIENPPFTNPIKKSTKS